MKLLQKTLLAVTAGAFMTAGAQAAVNYNTFATAQPYLGAKVGQYSPDDVDDDATSYGIYGGFEFTPNWGIEAEYLTTSEETAYNDSYTDPLEQYDGEGEYEGEVYGLYATYKYMFPNTNGLYAKGRLGVAKNEIELNYTDTEKDLITNVVDTDKGSESESDTGIAGGLGLGYNFSPNAAVELAYEWYPTVEFGDEDVDVNGITLGANFKF